MPFYQIISRIIFKICFPKSFSSSRATKLTFWKFYSPADKLWSPKTIGRVLGYTTALEAARHKFSYKSLHNPQENNSVRVSFLIKLKAEKFLKINKKTFAPESLFLIKLQAEKFLKIRKKTLSKSHYL